jgi:hypothetical protein
MTGKNKRLVRRASIRDTVQKTTIDLASIGEEQIRRVRRICATLPESMEKLSHGEPTFFIGKKVYAMFANNHHNDGHVAVWIPVEPAHQATLLKMSPQKYFYPPYVGVKGWVGVELDRVDDDELTLHLLEAWKMIGWKKTSR